MELASYQTQTRRRRLTGAYSDKSPLVSALLLKEDMEVAVCSTEGRAVEINTGRLNAKRTSRTQGEAGMTLKPKYKLAWAAPLAETAIQNPARYRARSLPIAGALLKDADRGEEQISLL